LNYNLIFGLVWGIVFFVAYITEDNLRWNDYTWLVLSVIYLGMYGYQKHYRYLSIENGVIKENGPFGKQIELAKVLRFKKFAGDYILKTEDKEFIINTQIIDPNSMNDLDNALQPLFGEQS